MPDSSWTSHIWPFALNRWQLMAAASAPPARTRCSFTPGFRSCAKNVSKACQQLHLQHAVEGLSVAAISYYVLSLAGAAFRAMHELHLPVAPELAEGLLIAPVVLMVIGITKRARRRVLRGNVSRGDEIHSMNL